MAFMDRGDGPSIDTNMNNGLDGEGLNNNNLNMNRNRLYNLAYMYGRRYYFIAVDTAYFIIETIITFIVLIIGIIAVVVSYKAPIVDPIESTKTLFINIYSIIALLFLVTTIVVNFFSKSKEVLLQRLIIVIAASTVMLMTFFGIKLSMDLTYTENKFEQIYEEQYTEETSNKKTRLSVEILNGVNMKTEKEFYVDECKKIYDIFSIKVYTLMALHLIFNVLVIYEIYRIRKIQIKKEKLDKDDLILFDEEENIKI